MIGKCPDFEIGVKFPAQKQSSSNGHKSTQPKIRNTQLPPIPEGASSRYTMTEVVMNGRVQMLHTYQCPSNECEFIVRNSLNRDGAKKTLDTHLQIGHRKQRAS